MSTGVTVSDEITTIFTEFKKSSNPTRYMIMKIEGGSIVFQESSEDPSYASFISLLPENESRYGLYKCAFTTNDGRPAEKIVSISWVPDTAPVKNKMIYAGSKDALSKVIVGVSVKINATDLSELTEEVLQDACKKFA
eukprot:gene6115-8430_t